MISLGQIKLLETKVESALQKIVELKDLNSQLMTENMDLQTEVELLQEQCTRFEQDEAKIEQGILGVLDRLNTVEDTVRQGGGQLTPPTAVSEQVVPTQNIPPTQQSAPISDVVNVEQVAVENTMPTIDETVVETSPVQQTTGMLNYAEKSAQLDIF